MFPTDHLATVRWAGHHHWRVCQVHPVHLVLPELSALPAPPGEDKMSRLLISKTDTSNILLLAYKFYSDSFHLNYIIEIQEMFIEKVPVKMLI